MEDIANQSQHPLLGKLIIALGFQPGFSDSLSQSIIPGREALPAMDGSQITTQLNDSRCYFHHSRAFGENSCLVPSPEGLICRCSSPGSSIWGEMPRSPLSMSPQRQGDGVTTGSNAMCHGSVYFKGQEQLIYNLRGCWAGTAGDGI